MGPMIIVNAIQGSAEWWAARYGIPTASGAKHIIQPGAAPRAPRWFEMTAEALCASFRGTVQRELRVAFSRCSPRDERDIPGGVSSTLKMMIERGQVREVDPPADAEPIQSALKLSAQRQGYMHRLLAEWRLQRPVDPFQGSHWTERGHDGEAPAAEAFEDITGLVPTAVGFIYKDESRLVGCSPDWVVYGHEEHCSAFRRPGSDRPEGFEPCDCGGVIVATAEVKTLAEDNHVGVLLSGEMPAEHMPQVQFQSWVTGVPGYFLCGCPPEEDGVVPFPPLLLKVEPDPRWHAAFDEHVPKFIDEMVAARAKLIELGVEPPKLPDHRAREAQAEIDAGDVEPVYHTTDDGEWEDFNG